MHGSITGLLPLSLELPLQQAFSLPLVPLLRYVFSHMSVLQENGSARGISVICVVRKQLLSARCVPGPSASSTGKACSSSPSWMDVCAAQSTILVGLTL